MNAREQLRQDWEARIADYKASGLTMAAWCKANHFKIDQLKYWLYKAKQPSSPSPAQSPTRFSNGAEPRLKKSGNTRALLQTRFWSDQGLHIPNQGRDHRLLVAGLSVLAHQFRDLSQ